MAAPVRSPSARQSPERSPAPWRGLAAISLAVTVVLIAFAGRYGYHRDELYFLQAGRHPAWGYPDQPPLTPLLARAADRILGGSLAGLRVPSALIAGCCVLLTGLTAREFGARRAAQLLAAGCLAVSAYLLAVGHLASTSTLDLLAWTLITWLVVRALRDGGRSWLLVGVVAGIALENKLLPAFLLAALLFGVVVVGPRPALRDRWLAAAAALAVLLAAESGLAGAAWLAAVAGQQLDRGRRFGYQRVARDVPAHAARPGQPAAVPGLAGRMVAPGA